jgi:hypothetical protein
MFDDHIVSVSEIGFVGYIVNFVLVNNCVYRIFSSKAI